MGDTSTTTLNTKSDAKAMNESDVIENMDADDLIFYHSLRTDLDLLQKSPSQQTINKILNYSKGTR
ncbi:MAG: hypothetical protein JST19_08625 [Bacteroidetes bacterium]|nr:hypothetical protein [Bacteroidota bacterium]